MTQHRRRKLDYIPLEMGWRTSSLRLTALSELRGGWAADAIVCLWSLLADCGQVETWPIQGVKVRGMVSSHTFDFLSKHLQVTTSKLCRLLSFLADYQRGENGLNHIYLKMEIGGKWTDNMEEISKILATFLHRTLTCSRLRRDEKMTKITIFCPKVLKILKTYLRELHVEGEREIEIERGEEQGSSSPPPFDDSKPKSATPPPPAKVAGREVDVKKLSQELCPDCHKIGMKLTKGRLGRFISCAQFPACHFSRDLQVTDYLDSPAGPKPERERELTEEQKLEAERESREGARKVVEAYRKRKE